MSLLSRFKNLIKPSVVKVASKLSRPPFSYGLSAKFVSEKNLFLTANLLFQKNVVPFKRDEKIRIAFVFQAASFWPSWESFWTEVANDDRFEATMLVCDDIFVEKTQFNSARLFLETKGIKYDYVHDVSLSDLSPHIVVLQTPYDGHRPKYLHGVNLASRGFRVVYIPYGIEIVDTVKARKDHFEGTVTNCAWRIYTFSKELIAEYKKYSPNGGEMVRALGHPKFDLYRSAERPGLPEDLTRRAAGRKIVLLKLHFPKMVDGEFITPSLRELRKFVGKLNQYEDLFFIFMPHPKFFEMADQYLNAEKFQRLLEEATNCVQYCEDDYRPVLYNCDYYIMDRSALVVEAAMTKRPILFVEPQNNLEEFTTPVKRIVDTLYSANSCIGIERFLNQVVRKGLDDKKSERSEAVDEILPEANESSGSTIRTDIVNGIAKEMS